jgi:hypothetical protein
LELATTELALTAKFILMEDFPGYAPNREKVFPFLRAEYDRRLEEVRFLWENERKAEALAELRKNERDSLAGPFLPPLRREMEQALGLGFTPDEEWRPFGIPLLLWAILGIVAFSAALALFLFRPLPGIYRNFVTFRHRRGFQTVIVVVFIIGLAFILLEDSVGNILINRLSSSGTPAVLVQTPAYRVPDLMGAVNAQFAEGQPVTVGDYRLDWCYAETSDGRSGWVKREAVITY